MLNDMLLHKLYAEAAQKLPQERGETPDKLDRRREKYVRARAQAITEALLALVPCPT